MNVGEKRALRPKRQDALRLVRFAMPVHSADGAEEKIMRVPAKSLADYPWFVRIFFWNQKRKYGQALEPAMLWARSPKLFLGVAFLYGMIERRSSPIEPPLRSLVMVRISQINECRFCMDLNAATLLKRGASFDKLDALEDWRHSNLFGERERVALEFAEAATRTDLSVDDELMNRLKLHFDDDAVIELTGLIAFQNLSSKFNSALDVQAQGFCRPRSPAISDKRGS